MDINKASTCGNNFVERIAGLQVTIFIWFVGKWIPKILKMKKCIPSTLEQFTMVIILVKNTCIEDADPGQ